MVDLSKFTSNKKILNGVIGLVYNQVYCQSLLMLDLKKFRVVTIFFSIKKNHKFLIFIHNNFFS